MSGAELVSVVAPIALGIVLILGGLLMVLLARRSKVGNLKPNHIAGVRTKLTLSSDTAWYAGQRAAGSSTTVGGWGGIVAGILVPTVVFWGLEADATTVTTVCVGLGGAAWILVWSLAGTSAAQRAARNALIEP